MTQQSINLGTSPNDGSGDSLEAAGVKINDNFTQLFENYGPLVTPGPAGTYMYSDGSGTIKWADAVHSINAVGAAGVSVSGGPITGATGTFTVSLLASGATAGTYSNLTVDQYGRITAARALSAADIDTAVGYTPANAANVVNSFNSRQGAVTLSSADVTGALGFTPANVSGSSTQAFDATSLNLFASGSESTLYTDANSNDLVIKTGSSSSPQYTVVYNDGHMLIPAYLQTQYIAATATNGYRFTGSSGYYYMDGSIGQVIVPQGGTFYVSNPDGSRAYLQAHDIMANGNLISTNDVVAQSQWFRNGVGGQGIQITGGGRLWVPGGDSINGISYEAFDGSGYTHISNSGGVFGVDTPNRMRASEFDAVSDRRLKDDREDITAEIGLDFVEKLTPITFRWNDKSSSPGELAAGYVAQDVIKAGFGRIVGAGPHEGLEEEIDADGYRSPADASFAVNYSGAVPYLHAALKAALAEIEDLKRQVAEMRGDR